MRKGKYNLNSGNLTMAHALADLSGVSVDIVRYYTRRGLLKPVRHPSNRYNLYRETDVARLRFIRQAKNLGYTLNEITKIFAESSRGASPCPLVREIIARHITVNRKALAEMLELQTRMEAALKRWAKFPDKVPDGNTICHLIESTPIN